MSEIKILKEVWGTTSRVGGWSDADSKIMKGEGIQNLQGWETFFPAKDHLDTHNICGTQKIAILS